MQISGKVILTTIITSIILVSLLLVFKFSYTENKSVVTVGILHSITGTMAISERSVIDATLMAIDEINASGGLLGRRLEVIIRDGQSEGAVFAQKAEQLIKEDQVAVIFGCWTSDSRKNVLPVVERYNHLLFYPVQYEGMESSPNIVYTGSAPNQQIMPAVKWALDTIGNRMYLVGSDYIFPHAANAIIKDQLTSMRGVVTGESYIPLGATDMAHVVDEILREKPDIILNTLNGDSNIAFFEALRSAGIQPKDIPTISFSINETEYQYMGDDLLLGDYAAWTYFQSVDGANNEAFVEAFKSRYGRDRTVTDPMEAAYVGVHLWAMAVRKTHSFDPVVVRSVLGGLSFAAPQGAVSIDPRSQHLWKSVRIGQFQTNGEIDIVWSSPKPVRPLPYPPYRTRDAWHSFVNELWGMWGGAWARPTAGDAELTGVMP
jgi:urea transport system substrate-binding protein